MLEGVSSSHRLRVLFEIKEKMSMVVVSLCLEGTQFQKEWEGIEMKWPLEKRITTIIWNKSLYLFLQTEILHLEK